MDPTEAAGLRSKRWRESYRTSAVLAGSQPVDILHDFYIPALQGSVRYDRMAGYFRSSSLAAASQGFSALVGKDGRVRLIVGADLEPDDVEAIIRGDQQRYAERLDRRMGQPDSWPNEVSNGVELLCWMVAHGYLEVRVAVRIHAESGKALPFSSRVDGYAHEKWAVFGDEYDNRLLATGSLNESKTALTLNAENLDVHCDWWDQRASRRVEDAEQSFDALWRDTHPHFRVMPLPEAVRRRLVLIGECVDFPIEIDGTSAAPRRVQPPSTLERLRFALLRDGPKLPGGRLVGMTTAPVEPWPHQSVVARRLIENYPFSYLLCDEVGLGKTIEAGLAIRSLYLSGLVKRVLIAPPASIKEQWQREMTSKFLLPFARTETSPALEHLYIHPLEYEPTSTSPYSPDLNIVSSAILARRDRRPDIEAAEPFDIVLIDEAHACRRRNPTEGLQAHPDYTFMYQTARDYLQTKSLWLATATPMQLEKIEAWDLLRLTNRADSFLFDPTLTFEYYGCLAQLVQDEELTDEEWQFLRAASNSVELYDPLLWEFIKGAVIDARIRHAVRRWLENGDEPRGWDRKRIRRLIFSAAPLSRVMMRHTRPLLELYRERGKLQQKLASREVLPIPRIEFTPEEQKAYDELDAYCDGLSEQIRQHADDSARHHLGFYKSFLRLRFASSFYAITETVRRRIVKAKRTLEHLEAVDREPEELDSRALESLVLEPEEEDPRAVEEAVLKDRSPEDVTWEVAKLEELLAALEALSGPSSKMRRLLETLDTRREPTTSRIQQTVIFTRFYDTLTEIVRQLRDRDPGMLIGTYSGKGGQYTNPRTNRLLAVDRERVKHLFLREKIDVLVCTDAAAEGLNLQTADLIINYDLPWNPMKLEQRIGRLDRIGQRHDHVFVLNLCYLGSAEEKVYGRLLRRLRDVGKIVGTQQMSMLPVQPEEFRQLAEGELSEGELERRASRRSEEQQERTRGMEIPPEELYDIYQRLEQETMNEVLPVDLDAIWTALSTSEYLKALGCKISEDLDERLFTVCGVDGVPDKTYLTTSRELLEQGLPDDAVDLHFASYGDRYFDAILEELGQHDLPDCLRRISVLVESCPAELVGYAVATFGPDGSQEVELVTAWEDLESIEIAEDDHIPDHVLGTLRTKLRRQAREEFRVVRAARRIERENVKAGHAQIAFAYLLAVALLQDALGNTDKKDFAAVARDLQANLLEEDAADFLSVPADELRTIGGKLLLKPKIPSVGSEAIISPASMMLRSAFDVACRTADAANRRWSELSVEDVIRRLDRRLNEAMREFHET